MYKNRFRSVVVITSALHAEGPRFEPERNHYIKQISYPKLVYKGYNRFQRVCINGGFRSVVVITCASHAHGPRFEPERNQYLYADRRT